jgi:hypothetical protein
MEIQQFKGSLQDLFNQATDKEKIQQARTNRTMEKTINVLCFIPSYGGHFLTTLVSLNSDCVPLKDIPGDSTRAAEYKYDPLPLLTDDAGNSGKQHWTTYHSNFKSPAELTTELYENYNYSSVTIPIHPVEFYRYPVRGYDSRTKVNYIQVSLDPKDQYIIDRFNRFFSLESRDGEDLLDKQFTEEFSPITVSLSQIMIGEAEFLEEYTKLCTAIGQEPHASALELYQAWRVARKIDLFKK